MANKPRPPVPPRRGHETLDIRALRLLSYRPGVDEIGDVGCSRAAIRHAREVIGRRDAGRPVDASIFDVYMDDVLDLLDLCDG